MRLDIFEWINKEFGSFLGIINYTENINEKLNKRDKKLYLFTEIMFTIGIGKTKAVYLKPDTHVRWREELGVIADLGCDGCRIKMEADSSNRSVTPNPIDIARGANPNELVMKKSFMLTVNIFKKILLTEN